MAADLGADGVEVDLRVAGDGAIAVIHDESVDRTTGGSGRVAEMDTAALSELGVPTLEELAILAADLGLWLNLEVKEARPEIARALRSVSFAHGGVVSSFLPDALALVAASAPHLPRALLTPPGVDPGSSIEAAQGHGAWNPFFRTLLDQPDCLRAARDAGLAVHVWTVNEHDHMRALASAGVDSIITDVPDEARSVLRGP